MMTVLNRIGLLLLVLLVLGGCSRNARDDGAINGTVPLADLGIYQALKIQTEGEGIYRLDLNAIGWGQILPENLRLTERGESHPTWHLEDGHMIFYSSTSESRYSQASVLLLENVPGQGNLMPEIGTLPVTTPALAQVQQTIRLEENLIYVPQAVGEDHWLWSKIIAPQSQQVNFELQNLAEGPGSLRIELMGFTQAEVEPDHSVRVDLNGLEIASATWDGKTRHVINVPIPEGILKNGNNQITITASGETESSVDIIELDWIEIDYPIRLADLESALIFTGGEQAIALPDSEQSSWLIFDVSAASAVARIQITSQEFQPQIGRRYALLDSSNFLAVSSIQPLQLEPQLRAPGTAAEYLAIGPPDLLSELQPLLELRMSQGLSTLSIPVTTIYDQFGAGYPEPEAIRSFLAYALENWDPPPRYVLLTGDTSYDFLAYQVDPEANQLPTMMVDTVYGGETGSDPLIAQVNADPWPDVAIGRIPARSSAQVKIVVDKILAYEQVAIQQAAPNTVLAVADGQEAIFAFDAREFLDQFPDNYRGELLTPLPGAENVSQEIETVLEEGALITAYFGHGSINMWGKDRIFSVADSQALQNQRLPIMLHLTCLTGLYTHPTEISLAESLLFNPEGGAIAVLAPTSLTLPSDQSYLTTAFVSALTTQEQPRLGDLALFAWRQVPAGYESALDVMLTYHLFGDPALLIPTPVP